MTVSALSNTGLSQTHAAFALKPSQRTTGAASVSALNDSMDVRFGATKPAQAEAPKKKFASWMSIGTKIAGGLGLALVGDVLTLTVVAAPIGIPLALIGTGIAFWGGYQAYKRMKG